MSELKAFITREGFEAYIKSEADKVIADLEESHKMEVEQLLMEIVELKEQIALLQAKLSQNSENDNG